MTSKPVGNGVPRAWELSNKRMKLTKLSAAWLPEWTCRLMPAPAGSYAGTASQLMRGVMRTVEGAQEQGWLNEQTAS